MGLIIARLLQPMIRLLSLWRQIDFCIYTLRNYVLNLLNRGLIDTVAMAIFLFNWCVSWICPTTLISWRTSGALPNAHASGLVCVLYFQCCFMAHQVCTVLQLINSFIVFCVYKKIHSEEMPYRHMAPDSQTIKGSKSYFCCNGKWAIGQ